MTGRLETRIARLEQAQPEGQKFYVFAHSVAEFDARRADMIREGLAQEQDIFVRICWLGDEGAE